MGTSAKCEICGTLLNYSSSEVLPLAEHFYYDHPEKDVGYFTINYSGRDNDRIVAPVAEGSSPSRGFGRRGGKI